jgi:hypothetical protein
MAADNWNHRTECSVTARPAAPWVPYCCVSASHGFHRVIIISSSYTADRPRLCVCPSRFRLFADFFYLLRMRPCDLFQFRITSEIINHWYMVGLLGRVISSSEGLYLHRTTQHRKTRTNIRAFSESVRALKARTSDRTATGSASRKNYGGNICSSRRRSLALAQVHGVGLSWLPVLWRKASRWRMTWSIVSLR